MFREDNEVTRTMRERLPEEQRRIRDIMEKVEAFYYVSHNDVEVKREIDVVVRGATRASKDGHILLITAESHAGKSTIVNHYLENHPSLRPIEIENNNIAYPLFRVTAPADCTMAGLGREMAMRLGYRLERHVNEDVVFQRVRAQFFVQGVRLVVINEFQHVLDAPARKGLRHLTDTLKNLLEEDDWPIHVILIGLPESLNMVKRDKKDQMKGRVQHIALQPLDASLHGQEVIEVIEHVLSIAGLESGMPLTNAFIKRLFHGAMYRLGFVFKMLHFAIEDALDSEGETKVYLEHWQDAYMRLAKEGRNVFVEKTWWTINRGVRDDGTFTAELEGDEAEDEADEETAE